MSPLDPLLAIDGLVVSYAGFRAIDGFSMTLAPGETRVLIGPNGAGKSTLCDAIIGRVRPTEGRILWNGRDITGLDEAGRVALGICRKFQAPGVLAGLTVAENIGLAACRTRSWWQALRARAPTDRPEVVDKVLAMIGLELQRDVPAGALSHGEKQWLEIGMVVATGGELLLLDEPTAGMGPQETRRTAELLRLLGRERAILVIDHDMAFVEQLDCPVTVMHQGRFLAQGTLAQMRANPAVAEVYLGQAA